MFMVSQYHVYTQNTFARVTNGTVSIDLPRNHQVETHLTAEAEAEGIDLMFCTQKV